MSRITIPALWARKPVAALQAESMDPAAQRLTTHDGVPLKRTLSAWSLVALGIGAIIGAGIFVLTGHAAAANAGPAISLSFLLGAVACAFAGLCYAEMASTVPIAGSAYTYAYATHGRIDRLDHRLGPDARICARRDHGRDRLVRLCGELSAGFRHHGAGGLSPPRRSTIDSAGGWHATGGGHQPARHGGDRACDRAAGGRHP